MTSRAGEEIDEAPPVSAADARTGTALTVALDRFGPLFGASVPSDLRPMAPTPSDDEETDPEIELEGATPEPVGPPPPPGAWTIDLAAAKAEPVAALAVSEMPLIRFLALVERLAHVPVSLDLESAWTVRQLGSTTVTVNLADLSVAQILAEGLRPLGLGVLESSQGWTVTAAAPGIPVVETVWDVADLEADRAEDIEALVRRFVRPTIWISDGDSPAVRRDGDRLTVIAPRLVGTEVGLFLERVRMARGQMPRERFPESATRPVRPGQESSEALRRSVLANFSRPTQLADILRRFASETEAEFVVDGVALAAEGYPPDTELTVVVESEPLGRGLDRLLRPRGLAWRLVDERLVEITTPSGADDPLTQWVPLTRPISPSVAQSRIDAARRKLLPADAPGELGAGLKPTIGLDVAFDPLGGPSDEGGFWVRSSPRDLLALQATLRGTEDAAADAD